jgi:hypothetical protein
MVDFTSIARLPIGLDALPLSRREVPYLSLPSHLGIHPSVRNALYRDILPLGAVNKNGEPYKDKFLRRYALEALANRARCEADELWGAGAVAKASRWEEGIAKAMGDYDADVDGRRDLFFRSLGRPARPGASASSPPPAVSPPVVRPGVGATLPSPAVGPRMPDDVEEVELQRALAASAEYSRRATSTHDLEEMALQCALAASVEDSRSAASDQDVEEVGLRRAMAASVNDSRRAAKRRWRNNAGPIVVELDWALARQNLMRWARRFLKGWILNESVAMILPGAWHTNTKTIKTRLIEHIILQQLLGDARTIFETPWMPQSSSVDDWKQ